MRRTRSRSAPRSVRRSVLLRLAAFILPGVGIILMVSLAPQPKRARQTVAAVATPDAGAKAALPPIDHTVSDERVVAETEAWLRIGLQQMARANPGMTRGKAVPDEVLKRIRAAQRQVVDSSFAGVWHGESIKRIVTSFGNQIPFVQPPESLQRREALTEVAYSPGDRTLLVFPRVAGNHGVDMLAAVLVHEATHVEVENRFIAYSGFIADELLVLQHSCPAYFSTSMFHSEGFAFIAQTQWALAQPNHQSILAACMGIVDEIKYIPGALAGNREHRRIFLRFLDWYVSNGPDHKRRGTCPSLVYVRGAHRGQPILFGEAAAPELKSVFAPVE